MADPREKKRDRAHDRYPLWQSPPVRTAALRYATDSIRPPMRPLRTLLWVNYYFQQ